MQRVGMLQNSSLQYLHLAITKLMWSSILSLDPSSPTFFLFLEPLYYVVALQTLEQNKNMTE